MEATPKNPVFTKVRGQIVSEQVTRLIHEESAFGEDSVREVQTSNKDYVITWAAQEPYDFGSEDVLTFEDLQKMAQARENTLAALKARRDEWKASQGNAIGSAPKATASTPKAPAVDEFNF